MFRKESFTAARPLHLKEAFKIYGEQIKDPKPAPFPVFGKRHLHP